MKTQKVTLFIFLFLWPTPELFAQSYCDIKNIKSLHEIDFNIPDFASTDTTIGGYIFKYTLVCINGITIFANFNNEGAEHGRWLFDTHSSQQPYLQGNYKKGEMHGTWVFASTEHKYRGGKFKKSRRTSFFEPEIANSEDGKVNDRNKKLVGKYEFHIQQSLSGGTNYYLNIRKDSSYSFRSSSHFEGLYEDFGSWKVMGDSIVLLCQTRATGIKGSETIKPNTSQRKYHIKDRNLCWTVQIRQEKKEHCFIK